MEGFIVLHRKLLEWGWYDDTNMVRLWLHLLLMANFREKSWHGQIIKRGQLVTGREELANQTGLSVRQVRTCLDRLIECGCITKKSTNKYTIITICKYSDYQDLPEENGQQTTSKRPTNDQQTTTTKQRNKETSKEINDVVDVTRTREVSEVFIDSKINSWKNADIVSQDNIPGLNPKWIEDIKLLVRRFNEKEITAEEVYGYYEDFKAQENNETLQESYTNWRRHFNNFIRKRIKRQDDERDDKANRDYNSPEARAKRLEGAAKVMRKLYEDGKQYYKEVSDH